MKKIVPIFFISIFSSLNIHSQLSKECSEIDTLVYFVQTNKAKNQEYNYYFLRYEDTIVIKITHQEKSELFCKILDKLYLNNGIFVGSKFFLNLSTMEVNRNNKTRNKIKIGIPLSDEYEIFMKRLVTNELKNFFIKKIEQIKEIEKKKIFVENLNSYLPKKYIEESLTCYLKRIDVAKNYFLNKLNY